MSWSFSIDAGSIAGVVFQIFSLRKRSVLFVMACGLMPGKNGPTVFAISATGAAAVHFIPSWMAFVQLWSAPGLSRMVFSVAAKDSALAGPTVSPMDARKNAL